MTPRRRSLSASLVRTVASNVAVPLSALLTGPLLARALDPEGRGEMAAVLAPVALAVLLVTFGLPEAITYHVAAKKISRATAVRAALTLGALCGALAGLGVLLAGPYVLRKFPDAQDLLNALAFTLPVIMGVGMLRYVAQGAQAFDLPNHERWFSIGSRVALLVGFAAFGALTVPAAVWSTHGTAVLATALLLPIAFRGRARRGERDEPREKPEPVHRVARPLFSFGLRTWVGTLSGIIILRLDQVLIAPLAGASQLGYYAVAVSVAELPATALNAVKDVMFAASTDRQNPGLVAEATRLVVLLTVPLCLAGILVAPFVVPLLFGENFSDAVPMAQVLLAATVPSGVGLILGSGLLGAGHPGLVSLVQGSAAVLTVAGLVVTVPEMGAIGAAWTALGARLASATFSTIAFVRISGLRPSECFVPRPGDVRDLQARVQRLRRRSG